MYIFETFNVKKKNKKQSHTYHQVSIRSHSFIAQNCIIKIHFAAKYIINYNYKFYKY